MAAIVDSFTAPNNATLERCYQITSGGVAQPLAGWILRSQWRYADGSLALDCTLDNGLIVVTDEANGLWKFLIQPSELYSLDLTRGGIAFDALAIPPPTPGTPPRVYLPVVGVATITPGSTIQ